MNFCELREIVNGEPTKPCGSCDSPQVTHAMHPGEPMFICAQCYDQIAPCKMFEVCGDGNIVPRGPAEEIVVPGCSDEDAALADLKGERHFTILPAAEGAAELAPLPLNLEDVSVAGVDLLEPQPVQSSNKRTPAYDFHVLVSPEAIAWREAAYDAAHPVLVRALNGDDRLRFGVQAFIKPRNREWSIRWSGAAPGLVGFIVMSDDFVCQIHYGEYMVTAKLRVGQVVLFDPAHVSVCFGRGVTALGFSVLPHLTRKNSRNRNRIFETYVGNQHVMASKPATMGKIMGWVPPPPSAPAHIPIRIRTATTATTTTTMETLKQYRSVLGYRLASTPTPPPTGGKKMSSSSSKRKRAATTDQAIEDSDVLVLWPDYEQAAIDEAWAPEKDGIGEYERPTVVSIFETASNPKGTIHYFRVDSGKNFSVPVEIIKKVCETPQTHVFQLVVPSAYETRTLTVHLSNDHRVHFSTQKACVVTMQFKDPERARKLRIQWRARSGEMLTDPPRPIMVRIIELTPEDDDDEEYLEFQECLGRYRAMCSNNALLRGSGGKGTTLAMAIHAQIDQLIEKKAEMTEEEFLELRRAALANMKQLERMVSHTSEEEDYDSPPASDPMDVCDEDEDEEVMDALVAAQQRIIGAMAAKFNADPYSVELTRLLEAAASSTCAEMLHEVMPQMERVVRGLTVSSDRLVQGLHRTYTLPKERPWAVYLKTVFETENQAEEIACFATEKEALQFRDQCLLAHSCPSLMMAVRYKK